MLRLLSSKSMLFPGKPVYKVMHADSSRNVYWIVLSQKPKPLFQKPIPRSQEVKKWQDSCGKKSWTPGHLTVVLSQVCLSLAYVTLGNVSVSVSSLVHRELKSPWPVSQIAMISERARTSLLCGLKCRKGQDLDMCKGPAIQQVLCLVWPEFFSPQKGTLSPLPFSEFHVLASRSHRYAPTATKREGQNSLLELSYPDLDTGHSFIHPSYI